MLVWRCGKHLCWMRYLLVSALRMTEPEAHFFGKKTCGVSVFWILSWRPSAMVATFQKNVHHWLGRKPHFPIHFMLLKSSVLMWQESTLSKFSKIRHYLIHYLYRFGPIQCTSFMFCTSVLVLSKLSGITSLLRRIAQQIIQPPYSPCTFETAAQMMFEVRKHHSSMFCWGPRKLSMSCEHCSEPGSSCTHPHLHRLAHRCSCKWPKLSRKVHCTTCHVWVLLQAKASNVWG